MRNFIHKFEFIYESSLTELVNFNLADYRLFSLPVVSKYNINVFTLFFSLLYNVLTNMNSFHIAFFVCKQSQCNNNHDTHKQMDITTVLCNKHIKLEHVHLIQFHSCKFPFFFSQTQMLAKSHTSWKKIYCIPFSSSNNNNDRSRPCMCCFQVWMVAQEHVFFSISKVNDENM